MGAKITIGPYTFEGRTLKNVSYNKTESLAIGSLNVNTLTAVVICDNPNILTLPQNEPVIYAKNGSQVGIAYKSSVKDLGEVGEGTIYQISAVSTVGLLTQMPHKGGIYRGVPASRIVADICGGLPYAIQTNMQSIPVYGWLPYVAPSGTAGAQNGSARDNLSRLLFAIGGNLRTDVDGVLRIENLPQSASASVGAERVSPFSASDTHDSPVTSVTVLEYQYIEDSTTATEVLFEGTTTQGQTICFDKPVFALTASGIPITESGANYAVVGAGNGTITGKPYTVATREMTRPVTASAVVNTIRITDSTVVGITNSNDVITRLVEYYQHRETLSCDIAMGYENPGDVVTIYNPATRKNVTACLSDVGVVASAVDKGRISALVGFTPWQTVAFEDVREVLTGSGTWTPPAGVTMVTAVLIEPGRGGYPGQAGEAAQSLSERSWQSEDSAATTYYKTVDTAQSGKGGAAGQGGDGGRILRVDIPITGSISFAYVCPAGGPGGAYGGDAQGDQPSPTTFGVYSTATGARSDTGYTDPIDGTVYAAPGDVGVPGGDGVSPTSTPDPILVDGQSYAPGGQGTTVRGEEGSTSSRYGIRGYQIAGGLGGGPAYGANGEDGASGLGSIYTSSVSGTIAKGGKGADALPPPKESTYGKGGRGGNGGGGGGSTGVQTGVYNRVPKSGGASRATMTLITTNLAQGGAGSAGGTGGDGVIILYYRRPVL